MKPTGIVRRVDDLGRVVMPKELRKTLRIRDGDPLEIYLDGESIMLKKYAPKGEIGAFAQDYAITLAAVTGHIALVADVDTFVAVAGVSPQGFLNKPVPDNWLNESTRQNSGVFVEALESGASRSVVFSNIVTAGEAVGMVCLCTKTSAAAIGDLERKLSETAASFIAKQIG